MDESHNKKEIGQRFKEYLIKRFGSVNEGARQLGKDPSALRSSYFNGKSIPGGGLLIKLSEFGADIIWILTGKESSIIKEPILEHKAENLDAENKKLKKEIAMLRSILKEVCEVAKSEIKKRE